jgi:hypothetical protein
MTVCRRNFDPNSSEMKSIQEFYDHVMALIMPSDRPMLREDEATEQDLTDLETTYIPLTSKFFQNLPENYREASASKM